MCTYIYISLPENILAKEKELLEKQAKDSSRKETKINQEPEKHSAPI